MSSKEVIGLVQVILHRGSPASKRELCILVRYYVLPSTPMCVLMAWPEHCLRQILSVTLYRLLSPRRPYNSQLRDYIGKLVGVSNTSIYLWVKDAT